MEITLICLKLWADNFACKLTSFCPKKQIDYINAIKIIQKKQISGVVWLNFAVVNAQNRVCKRERSKKIENERKLSRGKWKTKWGFGGLPTLNLATASVALMLTTCSKHL